MLTIAKLAKMSRAQLRAKNHMVGSTFPGLGYTAIDGYTYSQWMLIADDYTFGRGHPRCLDTAAQCRKIAAALLAPLE